MCRSDVSILSKTFIISSHKRPDVSEKAEDVPG